MVTKQFRRDSFKTALREASNRLKEALSEREETRVHLAELDAEVPALQQTIAALQRQLNPSTLPAVTKDHYQCMKCGMDLGYGDPDHKCKTDFPVSLSGMGSIRNGETIAVTEEETLPEPEGTPLIPEE